MKQPNTVKVLYTILIFYCAQGCSTSPIGTGAGIGAGLGAGVGALADSGPNGQNRFRNIVIGSAVGTALGAGAGFMIDRNNRDQREDAKKEGMKESEETMRRGNQFSSGSNEPRLLPPKTEAKWVPDQVKGSTFVPGHFEYLIVAPARWEGN